MFEFKSFGRLVRSWSVIRPKCSVWSRVVRDMNIDQGGNIFLLTQGGRGKMIIKHSPNGGEQWAQRLPNRASYKSIAVGKGGRIYVTGSSKVFRYQLEGAVKKKPITPCTGVKIVGIRVARGGRTASMKVSAPGSGRLTVQGEKIQTVVRRFHWKSVKTIPIRLKPRILKGASVSPKLAVKVRVVFERRWFRRQQITRHIVLRRR